MASLPKDTISRVILAAFAVTLVTLAAALLWIRREAQRNEVALSRDVRTLHSSRTIDQLKDCLGIQLRMDRAEQWQGGFWTGSAQDADGLKAFNSMTDIGVRLHDLKQVRKVVISTREGRDLRAAELDAINGCVGAS